MFRPKQRRAMLTISVYDAGRAAPVSEEEDSEGEREDRRGEEEEEEEGEGGKLLRTLPSVLSPNVRKPARAMTRQAHMEIEVL